MLKSKAGIASVLVTLAVIIVFAGPKHFGSSASWPNSMIGGRFGHEDGGPDHEGSLVPISEVWWISGLLISVAAVLLLSMLFSRRSAKVSEPLPLDS